MDATTQEPVRAAEAPLGAPEAGDDAGPLQSTCCIVGGGPGGMVLAHLLARRGIDVVVLEAHVDFDREFRGDTFHASAMELMAELGLARRVEAITRAKLRAIEMMTEEGTFTVADLARLRSPYPYVGLVHQVDFLGMLADVGRALPSFRLLMGARAKELIEEDGRVVGVRFEQGGRAREVRAGLVVAADGRGSRLRAAAGIELVTGAPPMDVLWFELPKQPDDEGLSELTLRFGRGTMLVMADRGPSWQAGYVILKGGLRELRERGIEELHAGIAALVPALAARVRDAVPTWREVAVLAVQTGCAERWSKPGLLLIGDAAHVMSPVGGVGINYAIMDAVAAFNAISEPLAEGRLGLEHLEAVERRRRFPVRVMQRVQDVAQRRIIAAALRKDAPFRVPMLLRIVRRVPGLRRLPAHLLAYGLRVERLRRPLPPLPAS